MSYTYRENEKVGVFLQFLVQNHFCDEYMTVKFDKITKNTRRLYCKTEKLGFRVPKHAYVSDILLKKREKWLLRNPKLLISQGLAEISDNISNSESGHGRNFQRGLKNFVPPKK